MYNLYLNGQYIMPLTSFQETLERVNPNDDSSATFILSLFLREEYIPANFSMRCLSEYAIQGSIQSIEIKKEDIVIYNSNHYSKIEQAQLLYDDDTIDDMAVNKVYIRLHSQEEAI